MPDLKKIIEKVKKIIKILEVEYPDAKITLNFSTPLELLVATILAAQCTDERVNQVTSMLFKKYKTANDYATAKLSILEQEIKPTGFYRNKAKNIIDITKILVKNYQGEVPKSMDELLKLPGVGRKTANVVLSNSYNIIEGIPIDTHVLRLSQRLGLTKNKDPIKIETDLMQIVPKDYWYKFPYLLIEHGRKICKAQKPSCKECILKSLCSNKK